MDNIKAAQDKRKWFEDFITGDKLKVTSYSGPVKDPWDDVSCACAQLTKPPIDVHKEPVNLRQTFGGRYSEPISVDLPVMISGMSYGSLSMNSKLAIHRALNTLATKHNLKLLYNTGEGGVLPHEISDRKYYLMTQVASGRFNVTQKNLLNVDAIEIKIGQGAKPGIGGQLPAEKVTKEIAALRRIPQGVPAYSPARHIDIVGPEDLFAKIQELRVVTGGKIPIGVKIAATDAYHDAIIASRIADFVTVDGMSAGTGASPEIAQAYMGIQTMPAIVEARRGVDAMASQLFQHLRRMDRTVDYEEVTLIAAGGITKPTDIYTALCLGANMVAIGTAIELGLGCISCFSCHTGKCPENITANLPRTKERGYMDLEEASNRIVAYFLKIKEALELLYAANGHFKGNSSTITELRTTNSSIHATTGIPMPGINVVEHLTNALDHGGCGIAAIIPSPRKLKAIRDGIEEPLPVSSLIIQMLEAQQVRGPDSAGFAFYRKKSDSYKLKLRLMNSDLAAVEGILKRHCNSTLHLTDKTPSVYELGYRIVEYSVESNADTVSAALDELSKISHLTLISHGNHVDVIKDIGTVENVVHLHDVRSEKDILFGLGHVRTATMSVVNPVTAHPFCTSSIPDATVVHNGEVTNAPLLKRRLQVMGFPFFAPTDSEVIAAFVGEKLSRGFSLEQACKDFVAKGDGPYSFLLATPEGIAFVKDDFGLRPAMVGYNPKDEFFAVATDIAALNSVGATEDRDLPGKGIVRVFPA
ncbi:MAG TPA: glutamate synthase-related protein [Candidatus Nanoarchaeia archaeon]|nr:glutamate synthase-related protein [Candidatus Nanoarchaeia archaeon]